MRKFKKVKNGGFTLLELIAVLAISGIVMALIFSLMLYNTNIYNKADSQARIQYDCTEILEILTVHAKESAAINDADSINGNYTFIKPAAVGTNVSLSFDFDENILTVGDAEYEYISDFSITHIGDRLWEIKITGTRRRESESFSTVVSLRN